MLKSSRILRCGRKSILSRGMLMTCMIYKHTPVLLFVLLSSVPITHGQKVWVLGEAGLLSHEKIYHLQFNANKPLLLIIKNFLQNIPHRFIVFLQFSRVSGKLAAVVKQNRCQRSPAAVNQQSPIVGFIMWLSKLVQNLSNIKEQTELLMSVSAKCHASTVKEEVLFLQSRCKWLGRWL